MIPLHDLLGYGGVVTVLVIAYVSARGYDHRRRHYALGKAPGVSISHFRLVYRYLQISSIGIACAAFVSDAPWLLELYREPMLIPVGIAISIAAAWLFVASKRDLGASYSPCFDVFLPQALVTSGIYGRIRHPIYTANVTLLAGMFVATGSMWLGVNTVVLAAYYLRSAVNEERELASTHDDYASYQRATGMFLPRLFPDRARR